MPLSPAILLLGLAARQPRDTGRNCQELMNLEVRELKFPWRVSESLESRGDE